MNALSRNNRTVPILLVPLALVMGFAAPAWAAIDVNDVRIIYGKDAGADDALYSRDQDFNVANSPWSNESLITADACGSAADVTVDGQVTWVVHKISPRTGHEVVGVQCRYSLGGQWWRRLNFFYRLQGQPNWTQWLGFPVSAILNSSSLSTRRAFDIAVESRSGAILVAYANLSINQYRIRYLRLALDGSLNGPTDFAGSDMGKEIHWVQVVPHPFRDDILLVLESGINELRTWMWRGGTFAGLTPTTIMSNTADNDHPRFDAAFEQSSGKALLVYNKSTSPGAVQAVTLNDAPATAWSAAGPLLPSSEVVAIKLASRPGGNEIAASTYDGSSIVTGSIWSGSSFSPTTTIDPDVATSNLAKGQDVIGVGWAGSTAVFLYPDKTGSAPNGSNSLDWTYGFWTGSAWTVLAQRLDRVLSPSGDFYEAGFALVPYLLGQPKLFAAVGDQNRNLFPLTFTEAANCTPPAFDCWSQNYVGGAANPLVSLNLPADGAGSNPFVGRPFGMDVYRYVLPTLTFSGVTSPIQVPIQADTSSIKLGLTLTITDTAGLIQADTASLNDGDAINNQEIAITLQNTGLIWDTNPFFGVRQFCLRGTATTKVQTLGAQGSCQPGWLAAIPTFVGATAYLDVLQNFLPGDTLEITDLDVLYQGATINTAPQDIKVEVNIREDADNTKDVDVALANPPQLQVTESLVLADPSSQATNLFRSFAVSGSPFSVNGELFRAQLTPMGNDVDVRELVFRLDNVKGIAQSDIIGHQLWVDGVQVPAAQISGWTTSIIGVSGTIKVTLSGSGKRLTVGSNHEISLRATVNNLMVPGGLPANADEMTIDLEPSGTSYITAFGKSVASGGTGLNLTTVTTAPGAIRGSVNAKTHQVSTYLISGLPSSVAFQDNLSVTWTPVNVAGATTVNAFVDSDPPVSFACAASPCSTSVPTSVRASTNVRLLLSGTSDGQPVFAFSSTFTVTEVLELANASTGQINPLVKAQNALRMNPLTDVTLFRFRLTPLGLSGAGSVTVNPFRITLPTLTGLAITDLTSLKLVRVADGSVLTVVPASTTVDFPNVTLSSASDYLVQGTLRTALTDLNLANGELVGGEQVGVSLAVSGLVSVRGSTTSPLELTGVSNAVRASSGSPVVSPVTHTRPGYQAITVLPVGVSQLLTGGNATVDWMPVGGADPAVSDVTFEFYRTGATGPLTQSVNLTSSDTKPYAWTIPSAAAASANAQVCIRERAPYDYIRGCSAALQVLETAALGNVPVVNALVQPGAVNDGELLRFTVTASGGTVQLKQMNFTVSFAGSPTMAWSNVVALRLFEVGVAPPLGTKTNPANANFTGLATTVSEGTPKTYVLRGDFTGLVAGQQMTVSLPTSGVQLDGTSSGFVNLHTVAGTVTGVAPSKTHTVSTYTISFQQRDLAGTGWMALSNPNSSIAVGRRLRINWVNEGTAMNPASMQFSKTGSFPATNITCAAGGLSQSFCEWDVPATEVSALSAAQVQFTGRTSDAGTDNLTALSSGFTVTAGLTVSPPAMQVNNALTQTGDLPAAANLLKFTLAPVGGNVSLTDLTFRLTTQGTWNLSNDVVSLELLSGSPGTPISGVTAAFGAGAMTLSFPAQILSGTTPFTLRGIIKNLAVGDGITVSFAPDFSGVSALTEGDASIPHYLRAMGQSGGNPDLALVLGAFRGSLVEYAHQVATYVITVPATVKYNDPLNVSWTANNMGAPTNFQYTFNGGLPQGFTCTGAGTSCASPASSPPTSLGASADVKVLLTGIQTGDGQPVTATSSAFKVLERLLLDPPASQIQDPLIRAGSMTSVNLLRVRLTTTGGGTSISAINFSVPSIVAGPYPGADGLMTLGNYELVDDATGTVVAVGPGSPSFSGLSVALAQNDVRSYTLRANISGMDPGERLTVALLPSGITVRGSVTNDVLAVDGNPTGVAVTHDVSTYVITSPTGGSQVVVATPWAIAWNTYGQANPIPPTVQYTPSGGSPIALTCTAPRGAGVCNTTVPDTVADSVTVTLNDGVHTVTTPPFTIAGLIQIGDAVNPTGLSPLNLPGGLTWLVGYSHQVTWQQLGSFTAILELSLDDGMTYPLNIGSLAASAPTQQSFSINCVNLGGSGTTCAPGLPGAGTDTAKVQARPQGAITTVGNRVSSQFKIKPAFLNIAPGGADIVVGRSTNVTWQSLAGTEPASLNPSTVFPIDGVTIDVINASGALLQSLTSLEPNDGSFSSWTPAAQAIGLHLRICDKVRPTICADGAPFNVVDLSVTATPDPARGFVPNSTVTITWVGVNPSKQVKLMLVDQIGTVLLDVIDNAMPVDQTTPAVNQLFPWTIPLSLTTPLRNVRIRLEQSDNPAVYTESVPFTIVGELRVDAPNGGEQVVINQPGSINWTVISGSSSTFRVRSSTSGSGGPWTVLALNATGASLPWTPNTVTRQGRMEVCDSQDLSLNICDVSNANFTVAGRLALAEHASGPAANAFVELPTVANAELFRFALTPTGENVELSSLTFNLSAITGIMAADIDVSSLTLLKDGAPVTAGFTVVPGAGTPSQMIATLSGVIVASGGPSNFVLRGTINNLAVNDEMTIGLATASIQAQGVVSLVDLNALAGALSGSVGSVRHFVKTYVITAPTTSANWPVNITQNIDWTPVGGASATNVTISYSIDGGQTYTQIVSSPNVPKPYPWLVPVTAISAQAKIKITDRADASVMGFSGGAKLSNFFNITGQITISAPAPDLRYADSLPRWPIGASRPIQWSTVGTMSRFRVYANGQEISGSPTTATSLAFTPTTATTTGTIRVVDDSLGHPPAEATANVVFSEAQVIEPNASSAWRIGTTQAIRWVHTGLQTVDLFYRVGTGTWQSIALAQDATLGTLNWSVPAAARGPQVEVQVRDGIDAQNGALDASDVFKVYGELQLAPVSGVAVNTPYAITWTTNPDAASVPRVRLELIDLARGQTTVLVPNLVNAGSYNWTPAQATSQARIRLCDVDFPSTDPDACEESPIFSITGIGVDLVPAGPHVINTILPISWTQEGVAAGQVRLAYSPDGGTTWKDMAGTVCTLPCGTLRPTGATGSYNWTIPDDISANVIVRVADAASPAFGLSNTIGITGRLTVTGPTAPANVFAVTNSMPIAWTTLGTIPTVDLEYSLDGGANWTGIVSGQANSGNFSWPIPTNAVSSNLRVRVVDSQGINNGPHPFTEGRSGLIQVGAKFAFTSPVGGENWAVNSSQPVNWNVLGDGVTSVRLAYSTDGVAFTDIGTAPMSGTSGEAATVQWTVADVVAALGNPQVTPSRSVMLRISDDTANHIPAPVVSASLNAFYYRVDWEVRDATSSVVLNNLQVIDSTSWTNQPNFDLTGLLTRYYPYLSQVSTLWSLANNNGTSDLSQGPADAAPVPIWASDRNQTRIVRIEVTSSDAVTWQVHSEWTYDGAANQVKIFSWLEKSGKIVDTLLNDAFVEIYENGALIETIPQPIGSGPGLSADPNGNYRFAWTNGQAAHTYFTKTIIHRLGRDFSTGGALNITLAGGGNLTLGQLQTELAPINTAVTTTLPNQVTAAQAAIQTSVATAQGAIQTDIATSRVVIQADVAAVKADTAAIKSDTTAIKAETDLISTQVIPKIDGVQAYLADPDAGLPKVLSNQDTMQNQLKAQRRGGILQRATTVDVGDNVTIQYRAEGGTPLISIYDRTGASVAAPPLSLNGGTSLYESTFSLAAAGEYRVVVAEPSSANSAGTIDSMTLTAKVPAPTPATPNDLVAISNRLATIETEMGTLGQLQSSVAALDATTTQLSNQVGILVTNLGSLTADEVRTSLNAIITRLGSVAQSTDLQTALGQLTALQTSLPALQQAIQNQLGTLATSTDVQSALTQLATLQQTITALQNAQQADLTTIKANLTALQQVMPTLQSSLSTLTTQLGTPAQAAEIQNALGQLAALQTSLAQLQSTTGNDLTAITTQLASLGQQLPGLQSMLTTLQGTLGTPAQAAGLQQTLNQLATLQSTLASLSQAPAADTQAILTKLSGLEQGLPALQASVKDALSSTAQSADLQKAMGQLADLQRTIASLQQAPAVDPSTLLAKMAEVKQLITGLSGGENSTTIEALLKNSTGDILRAVEVSNRLMQELSTLGKTEATATSLEQIKQQIAGVGSRLLGLPGQVVTEVAPEVQKVAKDLHQLGTEKGYNFDGLFEMAESQAGDVKTIRSRVEELKQLMEVQRSIIEQHLNQPVVKTWFEGG